MKKPCDDCDGCGLVANNDNKTPWTHLVGSDISQKEIQVDNITYEAKICEECHGFGKR